MYLAELTDYDREETFFFLNKSWFKAGVENVKDLLDEASRFISFDVFVRKFKVKTNYSYSYSILMS